MPSSITHILIAREAVEALPKGAQEIIRSAPDYYYLGAQGPDLFFFYAPVFGREGNLGKLLHRTHVREWFLGLLNVLPHYAGDEFTKCLAYAFGFCSHLAADAAFHPFVYNFLREYDVNKLTHQEIEGDWDVYFLDRLLGQSVFRYAFPFDLKKIGEEGVLFRYLEEVAAGLGRELKASAFRRTLKGFELFLRHVYSPHGSALKYLGLSELYPREEPNPLYLRGKRFYALSEERGRTADELFRLAADESALRIAVFLEAFNADMVLPDALFSLNLLTGKQI